jgi:hypothetical protein
MSKFSANYRVTLRSELPSREVAFVSALGAEITGPKGMPLYQLTCTEVSFGNPQYLQVKVFREPEDWLLPLYIPHELVLLISGKADSFPVGFGP